MFKWSWRFRIMSDLKVNNITSSSGTHGTVVAGVSTVSSSAFMIMPAGNTEVRSAGSGRAIFAGGYEAPSNLKEIQKVQIATTGNGVDFGDMSVNRRECASAANTTRGVIAGGTGPLTDIIEYVVMSSEGGANDFGNLSSTRRAFSGSGNDTRGLFFGGNNPSRTSIIEFINFASTGNVNEFGRLGVDTGLGTLEGGFQNDDNGSFSSPTRAFVFGSGDISNVIQFVTISTLGNSEDFGDLTERVRYTSGLSSNIRGVRGGGKRSSPSTEVDTMDFVTMATEGNATDFGNLTFARNQLAAASSKTRGVFAGGYDQPAFSNIIDYITITSTGDATDFGDLTFGSASDGKARGPSGCSDVNGGLG